MNETNVMAPLQAFHGLKPPAPIWFENAIAEEPERTFVTIEGARVETLAWGKRGNPGLVFLHGGAAHADWWSFVAPFFARERRVVAPTFTGMGRSDWREVYSFDQFVREAREAGRAAGPLRSRLSAAVRGRAACRSPLPPRRRRRKPWRSSARQQRHVVLIPPPPAYGRAGG